MKTCLLFPGNPAIQKQYTDWITEITIEDPTLDIRYISSYVIFDKHLDSATYDAFLLEHYEKIFLEAFQGTPLTLIAHSAGSYFALRILAKYPEKIDTVIVLFPYLGPSTIKSLRFGVRKCELYNKALFDFSSIAPYKDKVHFLYTQHDSWCPDKTIEALSQLSHAQEIDIPHDFIVSQLERKKMWNVIKSILTPWVK
ncbi:MAG: Lipid-droplet associated hydrolase [Candidatus Parcubacteria bacterium]|jgi:hypothetical protein